MGHDSLDAEDRSLVVRSLTVARMQRIADLVDKIEHRIQGNYWLHLESSMEHMRGPQCLFA